MLRKIILIALLIIIPVSAFIGYRLIKNQQLPEFDTYNAIPLDASLIIESSDFVKTIAEIKSENAIWQEITSLIAIKKLDDDLSYFMNLNNRNQAFKDLTDDNKLVISCHKLGKADIGFLFYIELFNYRDKKALLDAVEANLAQKGSLNKRDYSGAKIYQVKTDSREFYFAFNKGILTFSSSSMLLESSIRQTEVKKTILDNPDFNTVKKTAGKNVEANIYINFNNFNSLVSEVFDAKRKELIENLPNMGNWAELDINVKNDAVLLNGFTYTNDSNNNYLNIFLEQEPVEHKVIDILPSNTSLFTVLGISSVATYMNSYRNYLSKQGKINNYQLFIDRYKNKYNIDLELFYKANLDEEIGVVVTDDPSDSFEENTFALMRVKSKSITEKEIQEIIKKIAKEHGRTQSYYTTEVRIDKETKYQVYALPIEGLFSNFFGGIFPKIEKHYVTFVDNFLIASKSKSSLVKFIHSNVLQKTLNNDMKFDRFSDYLSSKSNFYFYTNLYSSPKYISEFLNPGLRKGLNNNIENFQKFQALAVQFQQNNDMIYNNIYLQYIPEIKEQAVTVWESHLDTSINFKPVFVTNHYTKENEIFVQDLNNKIYLINKVGRVLWKLQLNEKINSDIYQVDYYKNGKLQILFSTENKLHLIDRNGNYVERYPVKLRSPSTAGMALFDYDKNLNYRVFIPCKNKNVYAYGLDGNLINGWNFGQTDTWVTQPLQHFRVNNNDYILFADKYRIYILNRRGEERVQLKSQFARSEKNIFILDKGNETGARFVSSDTLGLVKYIYLDGNVETKQIETFSSKHFFDYQDINADGYNDFIFLDGKNLNVYKSNGDKLFSYKFDSSIGLAPVYYYFSYDDRKIGVVSETSDELYLLNSNGKLYEGFPLKGSTQFTIGFFENSANKFNLIVGSKYNFLYNYSVN